MAKPKIYPALLAKSEEALAQQLAVVRAWKTGVHLDIVDGIFAKPKSACGTLVNHLPRGSEVHLMVQDAATWKSSLLRWKPGVVILHPESEHCRPMITWCKKQGIKTRVALSVRTPMEMIEPLVHNVSGFHIMMGPIGSYGSTLQPRRFVLLAALHEKYPTLQLSVDVGINLATWKLAQRSGATSAAVGSYIFSSKNPKDQWLKLAAA